MKFLQVMMMAAGLASVAACATISTPEGGPKDLTAPTLQTSNPKDQQLNVKTNNVVLVFDEEVQQQNLAKELLITPNTTNPYKVKSNKNEMTLEFEKPLRDSTTFSFNFRGGIVDITEKNVAKNLRLSFSTGAFIDSSSISGRVINLLKQVPETGAVVALYQAEDTMSIRKNRPYYLTNTDSTGVYKIDNIKEGRYYVYALVDKNNNTYYDNEEERIAYLPEPLRIMPGTDSVLLQTIRLDTKKPILMQREKFTDRFVANYNEGVQIFTAYPAGSKADTLTRKISADGKAVELFKSAKFNGGKTILTAVDSSGNIATDTISIAFEGKRAQRVRGAQLKVTNNGQKANYRPGQQMTLVLETPVTIAAGSPITIMRDSVALETLKYPEQIILDETGTEISFKLPALKPDVKQVEIMLDSTALKPQTGEPISFTNVNVPIAEARGTGIISGSITTDQKSYIVQLLTNEYKVVEQKINPKRNQFKDIEPGTYRVRVLVDENNNGRWDKGDPEMKVLPERVYLFPNTIDVRANWEREDINLEF